MARAVTGCEFVLCRREATFRVTRPPETTPLLVCGMHVDPVLTWGVVLEDVPVIESLVWPTRRREGKNGQSEAA